MSAREPVGQQDDAAFPDFAWAVGEESSDPVVLRGGRPWRHDQLRSSRHYEHMEADLEAVAGLGIRIVRYGMPWRRTELAPGRYDWSLWDRALAACERAGLEPVVDLCHFGLPDHYEGFLDARWVEGFGRYVEAFLARYRAPRWFTPVNEPGVTAFCSGRIGAWNDRRSSEADHARILALATRANLEAMARIRADRGGWWIGAEGFPVPVATAPDEEAEVERRRALAWAVFDLHLGVEPSNEVADFLAPVDEGLLERIRELATTEKVVVGHDVYPVGVAPVRGGELEGGLEARLDHYAAEARRWHARYRAPFWVAETSNLSLPVEAQVPWLEGLAGRLDALREEGLPARGLCWYSRGDQFDWQTMLMEPRDAVTEVGLFDAERRPRPVAAALRRLARGRR